MRKVNREAAKWMERNAAMCKRDGPSQINIAPEANWGGGIARQPHAIQKRTRHGVTNSPICAITGNAATPKEIRRLVKCSIMATAAHVERNVTCIIRSAMANGINMLLSHPGMLAADKALVDSSAVWHPAADAAQDRR